MDLMGSTAPGWLGATFQGSQLLYLVISMVVGGRLLWLAHQTKGAPERWLGLQFLIGSAIAYPVLIAGVLGAASAVQQGLEPPAHCAWMIGLGYLGIDVSTVCLMIFVRTVFRDGESWAGRLCWAGGVTLFVAYVALGLSGEFSRLTMGSPVYWFHYVAGVWAMVWNTAEAFRYHGLMRRRLKLGLAEPVLTNRFLLWGSASVCGLCVALLGATPRLYMHLDPQITRVISTAILTTMSLGGVVAVALYFLTFFPTQSYLRWVERRYAPAPS